MIGKFSAKVKDYGVSVTKAGNPQVFVQVEFAHEEGVKTLTWYGNFSGGAKDIALKGLLACGLKPQHYGQLINLKNGIASGILELGRVVDIDVQQDVTPEGKSRTVVAWLNDPALAPQTKKIDEATNAQFFGQYGTTFEGDLIRLAQELGLATTNNNFTSPPTTQAYQAPPANWPTTPAPAKTQEQLFAEWQASQPKTAAPAPAQQAWQPPPAQGSTPNGAYKAPF